MLSTQAALVIMSELARFERDSSDSSVLSLVLRADFRFSWYWISNSLAVVVLSELARVESGEWCLEG